MIRITISIKMVWHQKPLLLAATFQITSKSLFCLPHFISIRLPAIAKSIRINTISIKPIPIVFAAITPSLTPFKICYDKKRHFFTEKWANIHFTQRLNTPNFFRLTVTMTTTAFLLGYPSRLLTKYESKRN